MFPKEIFRASERWVQKRYQNLVYWNELDRGGHFAAFERPDVFVAEIRACFARMSWINSSRLSTAASPFQRLALGLVPIRSWKHRKHRRFHNRVGAIKNASKVAAIPPPQ